MAKEMLPVNFMDDILDPSMNGKRRFNMIQNDDGTVSFEDATDYSQIGSDFGQKQVNQTNQAVNESADKNRIIDDLDDIAANTQAGMMAGALAVRQLNSNLQEKIYNESVISIADFYNVNTFDLRKKGNEVFLTLSLSLNVPADELPFFPNSKYAINKSPIIEELIPRDVFHIGAFGCNNTWGETNPVSAWIEKDGYIRLSTPKINTFYKFYGHWFVD